MNRSDAWFERQLAHVRACVAEADKPHTDAEIAAAEAALMQRPAMRQPALFTSASHHPERV